MIYDINEVAVESGKVGSEPVSNKAPGDKVSVG
jgi:hypothetical protein